MTKSNAHLNWVSGEGYGRFAHSGEVACFQGMRADGNRNSATGIQLMSKYSLCLFNSTHRIHDMPCHTACPRPTLHARARSRVSARYLECAKWPTMPFLTFSSSS